jgi:hypothetical protein
LIEPSAWVSVVALAETCWVLTSVYDISWEALATATEMLLNHRDLVLQDEDAVGRFLELFRARPSLGFSDCLMADIRDGSYFAVPARVSQNIFWDRDNNCRPVSHYQSSANVPRRVESQEDYMDSDVKQAFQLLNRQLADISKSVTDTGKDVDVIQKVMKYNLDKLNIISDNILRSK